MSWEKMHCSFSLQLRHCKNHRALGYVTFLPRVSNTSCLGNIITHRGGWGNRAGGKRGVGNTLRGFLSFDTMPLRSCLNLVQNKRVAVSRSLSSGQTVLPAAKAFCIFIFIYVYRLWKAATVTESGYHLLFSIRLFLARGLANTPTVC